MVFFISEREGVWIQLHNDCSDGKGKQPQQYEKVSQEFPLSEDGEDPEEDEKKREDKKLDDHIYR
jgi:hypothetical protein